MRPIISLLIAVLLAAALTACGQGEPAPADAVPAPEPVPVEQVREDPFAAYFDLSGLNDETLDRARQVIDQESTQDGVTVRVKETLGDGQTLYIAFDLIYPEGTDLSDEALAQAVDPTTYSYMELTLSEGADPTQAIPYVSKGQQALQSEDNTLSCLMNFQAKDGSLSGQDISLVISNEALGGSSHVVTWTVENQADSRQADLLDADGQRVGQAILTPFTLSIRLNSQGLDNAPEQVRLLDSDGQVIEGNWACSGSDRDLDGSFYAPVEPSTVTTIQAGPFTGTFQ